MEAAPSHARVIVLWPSPWRLYGEPNFPEKPIFVLRTFPWLSSYWPLYSHQCLYPHLWKLWGKWMSVPLALWSVSFMSLFFVVYLIIWGNCIFNEVPSDGVTVSHKALDIYGVVFGRGKIKTVWKSVHLFCIRKIILWTLQILWQFISHDPIWSNPWH